MRSIFVLLILVMIGLNGKGQSVTALPDSVLSQCCLEVTLLNGNVTTVDWVFIQYITRDGTGTKLFVEYAPNFGGIQWETQIRIQDDFDDVLERSKFIILPFTVGSTDYGIHRNWIANIEENTTTGGTWIYGRFGTPTKRKFSAVEDYEYLKNLLLLCRPRAIVVAENGLYTEGDTVRMGGFLIENTTITTEGYNWMMKDTLSKTEFGIDYLTAETGDTTVYWGRRSGSVRQMMQMGNRYWYNTMKDTVGGLFSDLTHSWGSGNPFLKYLIFNPLDPNSGSVQFQVRKDNAFLIMSNETTNPNYTPGWIVTNNSAQIGVNESGSDPGNGVLMGVFGDGTNNEYLFMVTKAVDDNTATNGQYLQLVDNTNGKVEFATIDLSAYLPIADTAAMLLNYPSTAGYGIIDAGKTWRADTTSPNGLATRLFAKTSPTTIAANYAAVSNGTNLIARNLFDNNTYAGVISRPWKFGEYTTAGLPTGVTGYTVYNTTLNGIGWYDGTRWNYVPKADRSAFTSTYIPFSNSSGQLTESSLLTWNGVSLVLNANPFSSTSKLIVSSNGTNNNSESGIEIVNSATNVSGRGQIVAGNIGSTSPYLSFKSRQTNSPSNLTERIRLNGDETTSLLTTTNTTGDLTATSRIGIGTTTFGTVISGVEALEIHKQDAQASVLAMAWDNSGVFPNTSIGGGFVMGKARGTKASPSNVGNGDRLSYFLTSGYAGSFQNIAGISFYVDGAVSAGVLPAQIRFETGTSTASRATRLLITSAGRVGIGNSTTANYSLEQISQTDAFGVARGTVAQRPTIVASTTPIRYNTDSTALEYGESVGVWRQIATRAYARSLAASLPTTITTGHVAYSNGTSLVGSANHFWDNTNGFLGIKTSTPLQELDVNGDAYIRDSTRLTTTPSHTAITGLLTRDANGWVGLASLAGGLSYSGGVLTGQNIGNTDLTVPQGTNRLLNLGANGDFVRFGATGDDKDFYVYNSSELGTNDNLIRMRTRFGQGFTKQRLSSTRINGTIYDGNDPLLQADFIAERTATNAYAKFNSFATLNSSGFRAVDVIAAIDSATSSLVSAFRFTSDNASGSKNHYIGFIDGIYGGTGWGSQVQRFVSYTPSFKVQTQFFGTNTYFDWISVDNLDTDTTSDRNSFYNRKYYFKNGTPGTGSNVHVWDNGTPSFKEIKRDTTIYVDDADYDFSAAITTAQIASRYNRIIFLMTTTGAAASDSELTLHTPDVNLMQCEILIRSTDEAGGFDNRILFGTNNAVSSTGTLASSYNPSAGQGVGLRVGLKSGVYKYFYY